MVVLAQQNTVECTILIAIDFTEHQEMEEGPEVPAVARASIR